MAILKILKLKITLFSQEFWDPYVLNLLEDIIYLKLFVKYLNSHLCVCIFAIWNGNGVTLATNVASEEILLDTADLDP